MHCKNLLRAQATELRCHALLFMGIHHSVVPADVVALQIMSAVERGPGSPVDPPMSVVECRSDSVLRSGH